MKPPDSGDALGATQSKKLSLSWDSMVVNQDFFLARSTLPGMAVTWLGTLSHPPSVSHPHLHQLWKMGKEGGPLGCIPKVYLSTSLWESRQGTKALP